jgi:hypothetical protein
MNVEIGNEVSQFPEKEYMNGIFFAVWKGAMGGPRGGEYYISKPRGSSGKIYTLGGPSSCMKRSILFLEIVNFSEMKKKQRSYETRERRIAPLSVY